LIFTSCGNEREGCDGNIVIKNHLPDITINLNDPPYKRDIFEEPVIFEHTLGRDISIGIRAEPSDSIIFFPSLEDSQVTGKRHVIVIEPNKAGKITVFVSAMDDCFDFEQTDSFEIKVIK